MVVRNNFINYSVLEFNGQEPKISGSAIIGDGAVIIGDVIIEENVNIWPNTTIRGDLAQIKIGRNTNIQDNCVIHVEYDSPCIIGEDCIIGHGVILHSAIIGNNCLVGMGSIVLNDSRMDDFSILGAGSMLTGKNIKKNELWFGSPAKFFRNIKAEEIEYNKKSVEGYIELAKSTFIDIDDIYQDYEEEEFES